MTTTRVPSRRVDLTEYTCDECKRIAQVGYGEDPPWPWRPVRLEGWVGVMHACCDGCELLVLRRHGTVPPSEKL